MISVYLLLDLLFCGLILKEYLKIFRPINLLIGYVANVAMQLFANYIDAATLQIRTNKPTDIRLRFKISRYVSIFEEL